MYTYIGPIHNGALIEDVQIYTYMYVCRECAGAIGHTNLGIAITELLHEF